MTATILDFPQIDIHSGDVEIELNEDGRVWINIDGICRLRVAKPTRVAVIRRRSDDVTEYFPKSGTLRDD